MAAAGKVAGILAPCDAYKLNCVIDLEAKLTRAAERGICFPARVADCCGERIADQDLHFELMVAAPGEIADAAQGGEAAMELRKGLSSAAAGERQPRSPQPELDRALDGPSLSEMLSQQFGPCLDDVAEASLVRLGDARVQHLASAANQSTVGDILHQDVLKAVRGRRRYSALAN